MQNEQTSENRSVFTCSLPHVEDESHFINDIIEKLKANHFIAAHQTYRLITGLSLEESFDLLQSFWREAKMAYIDTATYQRCCCYNCVGACGDKQRLVYENGAKLYDISANRPLGIACHQFMDKHLICDSLENGSKITTVHLVPNRGFFNDNPDRLEYDDITLALEGNVILERTKRINRISTSCENDSEVFSVKRSKEEALNTFVELITDKCNLQYHVTQRFFHVEVTKNGIKPRSGETRAEYLGRINQKLRDQRNELFEAVNAMSYDDMRKKVQDYLTKQNISGVLNQFGDFDLFIQNFFPGMSMKEIVIQLTQEG